MKKAFVSVLVVSIFVFLLSTAAFAATVPVSIQDFFFSPQNITIEVGDTVVWTNNGAFPHTTTSGTNFPTGNGIWDSHVLSTGQFFPFTFTQPGIYLYFCSIHGFTGSITVNGPSLPVPIGQQSFNYVPVVNPEADTNPALLKPLGIGPLALGGDLLNAQVALPQFQAPVDIYIAFAVSSVPDTIFNLKPDLTFQSFTAEQISQAAITGVLPADIVPWMSSTTGPVNATTLVPNLPVSGLIPGAYAAFVAITSPGSLLNFDLFETDFIIGLPITVMLSGTQEVPAVATAITATANFAVNFDTGAVSGTMTFTGLTSAVTTANFDQAAAGVNGPVILALTGGAGSTSGAWTISGTLTPSELTSLGSDGLYLNIHSVNFPSGEIRGQVYYPTGVPLP